MNSNPIDPEELRLRDAVVEAAIKSRGNLAKGWINADREFTDIVDALREHRAKASAAVVPERCEPPEGFRGERFHWIADANGSPFIAEWDNEDCLWTITGSTADYSPEAFGKYGYAHRSPAHPDIRVEPNNGAIADFLRSQGIKNMYGQEFNLVDAAIAHFSPTVSREPSDDMAGGGIAWKAENSLAFQGQTPGGEPATQTSITDEEIARLWQATTWTMIVSFEKVLNFARTLLSQHSNPISDDILLTLRDYALTRAGKDLYLTDARRLVANSNARAPNPSEQGG